MKLGERTFAEVLTGKPECFAVPHEFQLGTRKCDECPVRSACLDVSAQMFKALNAGMMKGRSINDIPYERVEGQNIIHSILTSAPNSSWHHPCQLDALPQIFDRAMRAYANRPHHPLLDELVAGIEDDFNGPNRHDGDNTNTHPQEMPARMATGQCSTDHASLNPASSSVGTSESSHFTSQVCNKKLKRDPVLDKLLDKCSATLEDTSDGSLEILIDDGDGDVDALLDTIDPNILRPVAVSDATPHTDEKADVDARLEAAPADAIITTTSTTSASCSSNYSFAGAVRLDHYRTADDESLIKELRDIYDRVRNHGVAYPDLREDYCAINRVLNERQLISPGFRPFLALPHKAKGKFGITHELLARDRMMFDIEWLHRFGYPNQLDDPAFANLLCANGLDYDLAATFVTRTWTKLKRIEILALSPTEQHPLGMFLSEEVRKLIGDARDKSRKIRLSLKKRMVRETKLLRFIEDYVKLWIATEVRTGEPQYSIGQLYAWQKGEKPPAPSTLSSKLKTLNRLIGP